MTKEPLDFTKAERKALGKSLDAGINPFRPIIVEPLDITIDRVIEDLPSVKCWKLMIARAQVLESLAELEQAQRAHQR